MDAVKIYTRHGWFSCARMKEFLSENGIPIENRDCTNDPVAQKELRDLGIKALPVAVRGSKIVVGFDEKKLIETFEIKKIAKTSKYRCNSKPYIESFCSYKSCDKSNPKRKTRLDFTKPTQISQTTNVAYIWEIRTLHRSIYLWTLHRRYG